MKTFLTIILFLDIYEGCLAPSSASVSRDSDDLNADLITGGRRSLAPLLSMPTIVSQDNNSKISAPLRDAIGETNGQRLTDIIELRGYFKKGFLEITPETYPDLVNYAAFYKNAFAAYDRGISLRGWNEQTDLKGLSKCLYYFNAVKKIKCRKNTWQMKALVNTLGDAIQFYENFETLDLKDSVLNGKEILKLLKVLPNPSSLQSLNIKASILDVDASNEIKKTYSNLKEIVVAQASQQALSQSLFSLATPVIPSAENSLKSREDASETTGVAKRAVMSNDESFSCCPSKQAKRGKSCQTPGSLSADAALPLDIKIHILSFLTNQYDLLRMGAATTYWRKAAIEIWKTRTLDLSDGHFPLDIFIFLDHKALFKGIFARIDLSGNKIGTEEAKELAGALKDSSIILLNLARNEVGPEGITALAQALETMTSLTTLDLSNNGIGGEGIKVLAPSLTKLTSLTALYLSGNQIVNEDPWHSSNKIRDEGIKALASSLTALMFLKELHLSNNWIGVEGIKALAPSLTALMFLKELDLSANQIGADDVKALAPSLTALTFLTTLNLSSTQIGVEGIKALAPALTALTTLKELHLSNNLIGVEGIEALAPSLTALLALTTLNLSSNQIGGTYNSVSVEGIKALALSLTALTSLKELYLSSNWIGDEGIKALAPALTALISLKELHLSSNWIEDEGIKALAPALTALLSLTTLDLSWNPIGDESVKALAPSLIALPSLTMLGLSSNQIGDKGIAILAPALKAMLSLISVDLGSNKLGDKSKKLLDYLKRNKPSLNIRFREQYLKF